MSERLDQLSILSLVLLSPIAFMSRHLKDKKRKIADFTVLMVVRITVCLVLSFVFLVDWSHHVDLRPLHPMFLALAFLGSGILLMIAGTKGQTNCPPVWLFVCGCLISSLVRLTSSFFHQEDENVIRGLTDTTLLSVLLILCSFADHLPTDSILDEKKQKANQISGREAASFPSRFTYHWVTRLALTACRKELSISDLHPLSEEDKCQYITDNVVNGYDGSRGLFSFLLHAFKWEILHQSVYRAIAAASQITVCVLLRQLVLFLLDSKAETMDGLMISLMIGIASLVSNFSQHTHMDMTIRTGLRMRTTLSCLIFRKSMTVSQTRDFDPKTKQSKDRDSIVNLVSVDAEKLPPLMEHGHIVWAFFVDLIVCGYFLWQELGVPGVTGLVLLVMTMPVNILVSRLMRDWQKEQMVHKDTRIRRTEEFVKGMKVIKMHAWEPAFIRLVQMVRLHELSFVRKTAYFLTLPAVTSSVMPLIATIVSFSLFAVSLDPDSRHILSPDRVFFCLSLFNYMRISLNIMPRFAGLAVGARVALSRIQSFLSLPDRQSFVTPIDAQDKKDVAVRMTDAVLTWNKKDERAFKLDIRSLVIRKGTLVVITGPVASGKSSLLSAILQDMSLVSGSVQLSTEIMSTGFVSQVPWIQKQSIRENILFGKGYQKEKLDKVLKDCELEEEVKRMAGCDRMDVGEHGSNLSGGQTQRLTIARACYADPDLMLMDDPFSAVDPDVGRKLLHNLFNPETGCLRHKTCIIVSNKPALLRQADQVVIMSGGRIVGSGAYEDLCLSFPELKHEDGETQVTDPFVDSEANGMIIGSQTNRTQAVLPSATNNEKQITGRIKKQVFVRYSRLLPFAWLLPIAFLVSQGLDVGSSYWITLWSQQPPTINGHSNSLVYNGIILLSIVSLMSGVMLTLASLMTARATVAAASRLHDDLLHSVMHQSMSFFECTPIGRILSRFGSDMDCLDNGMVQGLVNFLSFASQAVSIMGIVLIAVPSYAPVLLILGILFFLVYVYGMTGERQTKRMDSRTRSRIYSLFSESVSGRTIVRAFNAFDSVFRSSFESAVEENLRCVSSYNELLRWRALRLDLLGNVTIAAAALAAFIMKSSAVSADGHGMDERSVLLIGLAAVYAMKLPITLNLIVRGLSEVEGHAVAVERVLEYIDRPAEQPVRETGVLVPVLNNWPTTSPEIVFNDFSAKYPSSVHPVLHDLSFVVRGGEKVAIVGRTGAGKSTIAASLFRLMSDDQTTGRILIDGRDIRKVPLNDLRTKLSVICQDAVIFSESVRFNIDPIDETSDQDVWQALRDVSLLSTISRLDGHLEHRLSSRGDENLSQGQRQLLSLARVIVRNNGILVLDEATASLDLETESRILQTLSQGRLADSTVILIAHRLQTVLRYADRVLVLKDGRIVESGVPHILMADSGSSFYSLFHN